MKRILIFIGLLCILAGCTPIDNRPFVFSGDEDNQMIYYNVPISLSDSEWDTLLSIIDEQSWTLIDVNNPPQIDFGIRAELMRRLEIDTNDVSPFNVGEDVLLVYFINLTTGAIRLSYGSLSSLKYDMVAVMNENDLQKVVAIFEE
ncbi:MAG: hypothetical protein PHY42_04055 [Bacilli bacterium]|nr:hypothetical protein [Bacilli bacterium]